MTITALNPLTPEPRRWSIGLPCPLSIGIATFGLAVGAVNVPFNSSVSSQQTLIREAFAEEVPIGKRDAEHLQDGSGDAEKNVRDIGRLIESLASTNEAPLQRGKGGDLRLEYPAGYDKNAEEVVKAAGDKLIRYGTAAFELLLEHFKDKRFSYVNETSGGFKTDSVGDACRSIIKCQLEVYQKITIYPGAVPSYFLDVLYKDKKPDEWWESRRKMSLYEIQTETVDWAISEQKRILRAGKYRGENIDTEKLAEIITRNESTLETLRRSKTPIAAKRTFPTRLK